MPHTEFAMLFVTIFAQRSPNRLVVIPTSPQSSKISLNVSSRNEFALVGSPSAKDRLPLSLLVRST